MGGGALPAQPCRLFAWQCSLAGNIFQVEAIEVDEDGNGVNPNFQPHIDAMRVIDGSDSDLEARLWTTLIRDRRYVISSIPSQDVTKTLAAHCPAQLKEVREKLDSKYTNTPSITERAATDSSPQHL